MKMKRVASFIGIVVLIGSIVWLGGASAAPSSTQTQNRPGSPDASPHVPTASPTIDYPGTIAAIKGTAGAEKKKLSKAETAEAKQAIAIATDTAKIYALRTKVADVQGQIPTALPDGSSITGVGSMVTDKFTLESGRYKVTMTMDVEQEAEGFILYLYGPDQSDPGESALNELTTNQGTWTISTVFVATQTGAYFAEVSNVDEAWTLTFTPI